jgi:hypothetical protein
MYEEGLGEILLDTNSLVMNVMIVGIVPEEKLEGIKR